MLKNCSLDICLHFSTGSDCISDVIFARINRAVIVALSVS